MKRLRLQRAEQAGCVALLAAWVALAGAQAPSGRAGSASKDCGSVVIVRCEAPPQSAVTPPQSAGAPPRVAAARVEARRQALMDPLALDQVIIEADPVRRSLEDALSAPFMRPPHGTHTFVSADGSRCSCMNRCPPIPFPCCQCSAQPRTYVTSPGSSPLR